MKNFTKVFAIAITMFGFATSSFAQETATATASATIVTPISIDKTIDMNFGDIAIQSITDGTVTLAPAGTRTKTGGVTLPASATTSVAAASFDVAGENSYTYDITLPSSCVITDPISLETMTVSDFTCSIVVTEGALSESGTETFTVGATLAVTGGQANGVYTNNVAFDVIVNYN